MLLFAAFTAILAAQSATSAAPRFDVVSIKVNDSGNLVATWDRACESGRWRGRNVDLATIITVAYGVAQSQVQGIPVWNNKPLHQFDITATCPEGTRDTQIQPMLQAMLANRFALLAHLETRMMSVRTLELAKGGVKLKPASGDCVTVPSLGPDLPEGEHRCGQFYPTRSFHGRGQPVEVHYQAWSATTADFLAFFAPQGRLDQPPMVDETGLKGKYDFDFHYEFILNLRDASGKPVDQSYRTFQAMQSQLGLIFNQRHLKKVPMPVLVIDHVSMPTPN
jgi:uncharacterized protein (TIGR03435 family)